MDNSGHGPLQVPGFGEYAVDFQLPAEDRFTHGFNEYIQSPAITAREMVMVEVMNMITDKQRWYTNVFDKNITSRWYREFIQEYRLIEDEAWDWCITELKDKAVEYRDKHFVRVIDAGSCACKSDKLVSGKVDESLRIALEPLRHPATSNIVDPYLFPLIYGTTKVLQQGGIVELQKGSTGGRLLFPVSSQQAYHHETSQEQVQSVQNAVEGQGINSIYAPTFDSKNTPDELRAYQWSWDYQMLPCEVAFVGDNDNKVQITSYINNLHPSLTSIYEDIEKIISASIEPWNSCLVKGSRVISDQSGSLHEYNRGGHQVQRGRIPLRIITFGATWKGELSWEAISQTRDWQTRFKAYTWAKEMVKTQPDEVIRVLGRRKTAQRIVSDWSWIDTLPPPVDQSRDLEVRKDEITWEHPQPGQSFTYADWKTGQNVDRAVVKMIAQRLCQDTAYRGPTHERYEVNLAETYRHKGLQVIVKISSIDLQRQGRDYTGSWQLGGLLNEHIVAMSMYPYDAMNVSAKVSFRQETPMPFYVYRYEAGSETQICQMDDPREMRFRETDHCSEIEALAEVFGFESIKDIDGCLHETSIRYQRTGHVDLPQGRLVTFPNTIEHRLEASLIDQTLPGHIRYVQLYLVDPNYRICSTRNVPPQQSDWWSDVADWIDGSLAPDDQPTTMREAKFHKAEWLKANDRARFIRYAQVGDYYF